MTQDIGEDGLCRLSLDFYNKAYALIVNSSQSTLLMSCLPHDIRNGFMTFAAQCNQVFQWLVTKMQIASVVHLLSWMLEPDLAAIVIPFKHQLTLGFPCHRAHIAQVDSVHNSPVADPVSLAMYCSSAQTISAFKERRWSFARAFIASVMRSGNTRVTFFLEPFFLMVVLYSI